MSDIHSDITMEKLKLLLKRSGFQYNQNVFSIHVSDILDMMVDLSQEIGVNDINTVELKYILEFVKESLLKGWEGWKDHIHYDMIACLEDVGIKNETQKLKSEVEDRNDDVKKSVEPHICTEKKVIEETITDVIL